MRLLRTVLALSLACASLPALAVAAEPTAAEQQGRAHFGRGIEFYKEANFAAALAEFQAAYAAAPSWKIHYNLGQTRYQLQDYAGALESFRVYLAEGGTRIDAERKAEVEAEIARLADRVATVVLSVEPEQVELLVDDQPRGSVHGSTELVLSAGRRKLTLSAKEHHGAIRVLDLAGKTRLDLKVKLEPIAKTPPSTGSSESLAPPPVAGKKKSRAPFYAGLVLTGVGVAATTTLGVLSMLEHQKHSDLVATPNVHPVALGNTRDDLRLLALTTDIVGGVTIGLAAYTVVAYILTSGESKPQKAQMTVQPVLGLGKAGLVGTF